MIPILAGFISNTRLKSYYGSELQQSFFEDFFGKGRWYWIYDFVSTFRKNDRPIYIALCS